MIISHLILKCPFELLKWFDQFSDLAKTGLYMLVALLLILLLTGLGQLVRVLMASSVQLQSTMCRPC